MNSEEKELELKYVFERDIKDTFDKVVESFLNRGFKPVSTSEKVNNDDYYDTRDFYFYKNDGSLRIRKRIENDETKYKGTYKMSLGEWTIYSSRTEMERSLKDSSFHTFQSVMENAKVPFKFSQVMSRPILNSTTRRTDLVFELHGDLVCLSLDDITYTGYSFDGVVAYDKMVEIEAVDTLKNPHLLDEIHEFVTSSDHSLVLTKESKYKRGFNKLEEEYKRTLVSGSRNIKGTSKKKNRTFSGKNFNI